MLVPKQVTAKNRNADTQTGKQSNNDCQSDPVIDQSLGAIPKSSMKSANTQYNTKQGANNDVQIINPQGDISTKPTNVKTNTNPVSASKKSNQNVNKKFKSDRSQSLSPNKISPDSKNKERVAKGSKDTIQCFNKFASLEDYEMEGVMSSEHDPGGSKPPRKPIEAPR